MASRIQMVVRVMGLVALVLSPLAIPAQTPASLAGLPTPDWTQDLVICEIATKGFTSPAGAESGTFNSLAARLPYLQKLGVNAIWLTGHSLSDPKHFYGIWTQYACIEPDRLDPSLGSEADFKRLVAQAHGRGIRILLDVISHGVMSGSSLPRQHPTWFKGGSWGMTDYDWAGQVKELDEWWVALWTRMAVEFGVDGYRIDCGLQGRPDLYRCIAQNAARAGHPIVILGEFFYQPEATHGVQGIPGVYHPQTGKHQPEADWLNVGRLLTQRAEEAQTTTSLKGEWDVITYSCHDCGWEGYPPAANPYMNDNLSRWSLGYTALLAPAIPVFMAGEEFSARYVPLPGLKPDLYGKQAGPGRWLYGSWLQWDQLKDPPRAAMLADTRRMLRIRHDQRDLLRAFRRGDPARRVAALEVTAADGVKTVPYLVWNEHKALAVFGNEGRQRDALMTVTLPTARMGWGAPAKIKVRDLWSGRKLKAEVAGDRVTLRVPVPRDGIPGGGLAVLRLERGR